MDSSTSCFRISTAIFFLAVVCLPLSLTDRDAEAAANDHRSTPVAGCVWADTSKGGIIDLQSIANKDGTARFLDKPAPDTFLYSYNPCFGFTEGTCTNAFVCQATATKDEYYLTGAVSNGVQVSQDSKGRTILHYQAITEIQRNSYVTLICDMNAHEPSMVALGDVSYAEYHMELTTKCACPNGCSGSGPDFSITIGFELSVGSILSITSVGVFTVYLLAGVVYNWARHHRHGSELIPNLSLWSSLPGLIKDGCMFTRSKLCGSGRAGYNTI